MIATLPPIATTPIGTHTESERPNQVAPTSTDVYRYCPWHTSTTTYYDTPSMQALVWSVPQTVWVAWHSPAWVALLRTCGYVTIHGHRYTAPVFVAAVKRAYHDFDCDRIITLAHAVQADVTAISIHLGITLEAPLEDAPDALEDTEAAIPTIPIAPPLEAAQAPKLAVLKRTGKGNHSRIRRRVWYTPSDGTIIDENFVVTTIAPYSTLSLVLIACNADTLYVMPGQDNLEAWYLEPSQHGATVDILKRNSPPSAIITTAGHEQAVYAASVWFDTGSYTARDCVTVWQRISADLKAIFDDSGAQLANIPSGAAVDLLKRSLPAAHEYPVLPDDLLALFQDGALFGQGHTEALAPQADRVHDLYELDGVFMYAACLTSVPTGPYIHDNETLYEPYIRGFYHVHVTIPDDWHHIGILRYGQRVGKETRTSYPSFPGMQFETWTSDMEYRLALKYGWTLDVVERVLWREHSSDPLRTWGKHLVTLRISYNALAQPHQGMARAAMRNILLQGVGLLRKRSNVKDCITATAETIPENVIEWQYLADGSYAYQTDAPMTQKQTPTIQPQWANYIWAHARVRLHTLALALPINHIVALNTDAVWLTEAPPATLLGDANKPGNWRVKSAYHDLAMAWPTTLTPLRALKSTTEKE